MATDVHPDRSLYTRPAVSRYGHEQAARLDARLAELDARTTLRPIAGVEELLLTPDGVTQSGDYRYTWAGFAQVAQELAPGLSKLIPDIAGCYRRPENEPEFFDLLAAINMFNAVLSLRFELLSKKQVILNCSERLIEGVVSSTYKFLENRALYQQASEAIAAAGRDVQFYGAEVVGRRLTLWYRGRRPAFRVSVGKESHDFWIGYYFCNGEASNTSLRGTAAVFSRFGCCLEAFRDGTRINHAGRNFNRRVEQLFNRVAARELKVDSLREGVECLMQASLKISGTADAQAQQEERVVQALCRRGIGQWVAQDIVRNAIYVGKDVTAQPEHRMIAPDLHASRTTYDLFCAMLRQSRKLGLDRREKVEQVAYELLVRKLKL